MRRLRPPHTATATLSARTAAGVLILAAVSSLSGCMTVHGQEELGDPNNTAPVGSRSDDTGTGAEPEGGAVRPRDDRDGGGHKGKGGVRDRHKGKQAKGHGKGGRHGGTHGRDADGAGRSPASTEGPSAQNPGTEPRPRPSDPSRPTTRPGGGSSGGGSGGNGGGGTPSTPPPSPSPTKSDPDPSPTRTEASPSRSVPSIPPPSA